MIINERDFLLLVQTLALHLHHPLSWTFLLLVVLGLEEVHREAEVASLRSGVHGRFVHVQVEGTAAVDEHQDEQTESCPSSCHGCRGPSRVS